LIEITPEYKEVFDAIERRDPFIFVSGRAGTGKTTLVTHLRDTLDGNVVVVAPTGVAALQVRGVTIHSFFKFPPRLIFPEEDIKKLKDRRLYSKIRLLIIDEVSMVRADIVDAIDLFLRVNGPKEGIPFGGVQVLFVGDLFQLPPVVRSEELEVLRSRSYEAPYFFHAMALHRQELTCIELKKIYRQKDASFTALLNDIRVDRDVPKALEILNAACYLETAEQDEHAITLTTNNAKADNINLRQSQAIQTEPVILTGQVSGRFNVDERNLPAPLNLTLKVGSRVMLTANDQTYPKRWVNGSLGVVRTITSDYVKVELDHPLSKVYVEVPKSQWETYQYEFDDLTQQIKPVVIGTYSQYPLMLAWAVTIHKSQGKTLERVKVDLSGGAFAPGQVYVALSRCTSLEGITLEKPIRRSDVKCDPNVKNFYQRLQIDF
jgi:ATP-dependent exoDNAse (exonuclease V) alpha subunit